MRTVSLTPARCRVAARLPTVGGRCPGPRPTFDEAVSLACALLNRVLKGPVSGNWDPVAASWTPPADWQPTRPMGMDGPKIESVFNESFANCRVGGEEFSEPDPTSVDGERQDE
jgi:hypothetical protein